MKILKGECGASGAVKIGMVELKNISYSVKDETSGKMQDILKDINIRFDDASITVITGPNGSGKSTLIKLLMGLEKPTAGRILFNGEDVTPLSVTERAKRGFTIAFQQPVRFKGISVKKLLTLASGEQQDIGQMCGYLSAVGLCARDYIDRQVDGTLSGGELKRIELAMALAKGGEVFLLDEPEAGIDLWSFEDLVRIFNRLRDKTVIIVSHQHRILETADRIVLFENDKVVTAGKKEEMFEKLAQRPALCSMQVKEV